MNVGLSCIILKMAYKFYLATGIIITIILTFVGVYYFKLITSPKTSQLPVKTKSLQVIKPIPTFIPSPSSVTPSLPSLHGDVIFNLINQYRVSKGLPFYIVSNELCNLAQERANYLIANNMAAFKSSSIGNHTGFREMTANYSGSGVGEDLLGNVTSDQYALADWQSSPPHNALLLATNYQGEIMTKACVATIVKPYGDIAVLLVGDK